MRTGAGGPENLQVGTMPQAQLQITSGQMHRGHMPPLVSAPGAHCSVRTLRGTCGAHADPSLWPGISLLSGRAGAPCGWPGVLAGLQCPPTATPQTLASTLASSPGQLPQPSLPSSGWALLWAVSDAVVCGTALLLEMPPSPSTSSAAKEAFEKGHKESVTFGVPQSAPRACCKSFVSLHPPKSLLPSPRELVTC